MKAEMSLEDAKHIIDICKELGTKAVTITGGGEPLLYPHIEEIIKYFHEKDIKIGFVCNGLSFDSMDPEVFNLVTWCRISNDDFRELVGAYKQSLVRIVENAPDVDWAFSHVVSKSPNAEEIERVVQFANEHGFTHVRLVSDLFEPENIPMDFIRGFLVSRKVDDRLVIYQGRKEYERGGDCYICYLKPFICADRRVTTCCGSQYALEPPTYDFPQELTLGDAFDLKEIIAHSNIPFDGSICAKCYYMTYNRVLEGLLSDIRHREFV